MIDLVFPEKNWGLLSRQRIDLRQQAQLMEERARIAISLPRALQLGHVFDNFGEHTCEFGARPILEEEGIIPLLFLKHKGFIFRLSCHLALYLDRSHLQNNQHFFRHQPNQRRDHPFIVVFLSREIGTHGGGDRGPCGSRATVAVGRRSAGVRETGDRRGGGGQACVSGMGRSSQR